MSTIAEARSLIESFIVDGPPNSITPSKLRQSLTTMLDALAVLNGPGFTFKWSTATTTTDPGEGYIKANNANPASATAFRISETSLEGGIAGYLTAAFTSTSASKGVILIFDASNRDNFIAAEVTSVTDNGAFRTLSATVSSVNGSLLNDTTVVISIAPRGNEGSGAVSSVFGRDGVVAAAGGDYAASQITNDSAVSGVGVAAALGTLNTALATKANTASPSFTGNMSGSHTMRWGNGFVVTTDWDTIGKSGVYYGSNVANAPEASVTFIVLVLGAFNEDHVVQLAWRISASAYYIRRRSSGAWSSWQSFFHTDNAATSAQFRTGTSSTVPLVPSSVWAANAVLTDAATIAVDIAAGFDFGGATNGLLLLGDNRTLGAPSNIKTAQKGVLWFGATGGTRTLTLNAAWLLMDGVEVGPYSITTAQLVGVAYATRGSVVYVTAILRRAA